MDLVQTSEYIPWENRIEAHPASTRLSIEDLESVWTDGSPIAAEVHMDAERCRPLTGLLADAATVLDTTGMPRWCAGARPAEPGELCTCGRPVVVVWPSQRRPGSEVGHRGPRADALPVSPCPLRPTLVIGSAGPRRKPGLAPRPPGWRLDYGEGWEERQPPRRYERPGAWTDSVEASDMAEGTEPSEEDQAIGRRARHIRRRRELSLDVAAGLAGISKSYLSKLETGKKGFTRRGLIEDIAAALGCSPADLTGQPYSLRDRDSTDVADAVSEISRALYDTTLDDLPDLPARPLHELVSGAALAHASADEARYGPAGQGLADLLVELQLQAATSGGEQRQAALGALVEVCKVAYILAKRIGRIELAAFLAQRGRDAARVAERPDLIALMEMSRTSALLAVGARRRGRLVCAEALRDVSAHGPTRTDTTAAESAGMLHLTSALIAARDGRGGDADTHLGEARSLAAHTGERNHMRYHFGPTNVVVWELGLAVESGTGPAVAQRLAATPIDLSVFNSRGRVAYVHFDMARAWAQAGGSRDDEVIRQLDRADRLAPIRVRLDPIARDLALSLRRRAKRRVWELDSLCHRLGVS